MNALHLLDRAFARLRRPPPIRLRRTPGDAVVVTQLHNAPGRVLGPDPDVSGAWIVELDAERGRHEAHSVWARKLRRV